MKAITLAITALQEKEKAMIDFGVKPDTRVYCSDMYGVAQCSGNGVLI